MIYIKKEKDVAVAYCNVETLEAASQSRKADLVVSDAEWAKAGFHAHINGTGKVVLGSPAPTLEELKERKKAQINTTADKAIATLTATYPDREIATFDKQEAEARAYTADPSASTPLLSALSQARGVPLDELVRRVLVKADAFAVASGSIIGQRQALEDRLDACATVEEVEALAVTLSMPGAEAGA